ncbi:MAG: 2Fe-2S iron-sulfur cluster binding domain-containing protein, partial [Anaerolineae bacterium]|nr:2Fe-2S iron-sulfur cluster binding domain-containing protein [Anaerolineae bacterium]
MMSGDRQHHVIFMPSGLRGYVPDGTLLMDAARQLGVELESICNGQGTCHKCRVHIETGEFPKHGITSDEKHLSPPTVREQQSFGKAANATFRLACQARIEGDLLVSVPEASLAHKQIIRKSANTQRPLTVKPAVRPLFVTVEPAMLDAQPGDWERLQTAIDEQHHLNGLRINLHALRKLQATLRAGDWQTTIVLREDRDILDVRPGYEDTVYGVAVDIGTTTVVAHLCDLRTGAVLATEAAMNPQVAHGEDVMSRISYVMMQPNGLDTLHRAIIDTLNRLIASAAESAGVAIDHIYDLVVVGNTTMTHLFL